MEESAREFFSDLTGMRDYPNFLAPFICSQQIRSLFYSLNSNSPIESSVHGTSISSHLRNTVMNLLIEWDLDFHRIHTETVKNMLTIGDFLFLNGRYFPTPLRYVKFSDFFLQVGLPKDPYDLFSNAVQNEYFGIARYTNKHQVFSPILTSEEWLSLPYDDIKKWKRDFLNSLTYFELDMESINRLKVYSNGFWRQIDELDNKPALILCRERIKTYESFSYTYYLLKKGLLGNRTYLASEISRTDARRIQPLISGEIHLQVIQENDFFTIKIPFPMPEPEARILSLGIDMSHEDETKEWPKIYAFPMTIKDDILKIFWKFGYRTQVK